MASDLALRILLQAQDMASSIIKNVGSSLQNLGSSASGANPGLLMAASGAALVAGAILSTIQPAADFQSQLTNLVTAAGESKSNLGLVSDSILKIAIDTGTATKDLTSTMFMINSAGNKGADGLNVLRIAAEGAKTDNADLTTTTMALTGVMTNFKIPASGAAGAMNELIAASKDGKMHLQDLAGALGPVGEVAVNAGLKFADVGSAIAMMTNANVSARQASQNLAFAIRALDAPSGVAVKSMTAVGLKAQDVADTLRNQGLPAALQLIEDHVGKKFPASSVEWTTAMKNIMGGKAGLNVALAIGGDNLKAYQKNVNDVSGALKAGGTSVEGWSEVQNTLNVKMQQAQEAVEVLRIKIGTALLPVMTRIMGAITPLITGFSKFIDWLSKANLLTPILMGVLAGCAALILAVVVPALWSMAAGVLAATWPFALIAAAIAAAVAAFLYFYNNSAPFKGFVDGMVSSVKNFAGVLGGDLKTVLGFIGNFLQSTFTPVWKQLQDTWNNQILPSVRQLIATFDQVKPQLTMLAQFIGGVLVVAFGLLVGAIAGFVKGLAGVISGLIEALGGIFQFLTGLIQFISGIVAFVVDLFTGRWGKLRDDLGVIWNGVANMFQGFGNTVKGIFDALVKGVEGEFSGFADGITGYFNQILHGADDKTKAAAEATHKNSLEAKDKMLTNTESMQIATIQKYDHMRMQIEDQLNKTTNIVDKATLTSKLKAVINAGNMETQVWEKTKLMHNNVSQELTLMKNGIDTTTMSAADKAKANSLIMKDNMLKNAEDTDTQTIQKFDDMRQGILKQLDQTQDGVKRHSLEIQLTQVNHAEKTAIGVKKQHEKMRKNVESELDKFKKSAADKFGSVQKDVQNIVGNTGKWIQDKWKDAVNGVVGSFNWLYNHNYYFKDLVDTIKNWISGAQKWLSDTWKTISTDATNAWNGLVNGAKQLWKNISQPFINAWNDHIKGPMDTLGNNIKGTWDSIVNQATQWGKNLIQNIINGITGMASQVSKTASDVAANIAKFLGFHSPAKEGPGSEAGVWAPNLIKMYSQGLESGIPQMQKAANDLMKPIALTLNTGALNSLGSVNLKSPALSSSPLQGGSSASGNGVTIINNTFNISTQGGWSRNQVDDMYKQIKQKFDQDYRKSGNHITNTSGGRV